LEKTVENTAFFASEGSPAHEAGGQGTTELDFLRRAEFAQVRD
jgi:hypothetical protein